MTCRGVKADGSQCRSSLGLSADGLCRVHDPARAAEVAAMRSAGGSAAGASRRAARATLPADVPKAPKTLDDAVAFASWLTRAVCVGAIDARTAHEAGYCLNAFKAAAEKLHLEREIKALRKQLADLKGPARRGV